MATLSVPTQLAWIRQVLDGPIVLLKGPEVAVRYPDPAVRPFGDLDLLVPDADQAHQSLIEAGCVEVTAARPHHRPGLRSPNSLLLIEIHERPNGPKWSKVRTDELFATAVPSALSVEGIMTVLPAQHAVLLAAHSWHHEPFRRLIDLIDIAAMSEGQDTTELQELANRWGVGRVWKITQLAIDAFCAGEPPQAGMCRILGNHFWEVRERTRGETRLALKTVDLWAPMSLIAAQEIVKKIVLAPPGVARQVHRLKAMRDLQQSKPAQ
jgi:hypothetical protein